MNRVTTAIYYDLDLIREEDVARAVARAGPDALHVRQTDAAWPKGVGVASVTIASARDYCFRDHLMHFMNRLRLALPSFERHGVDLLEVARYEWLFDTEESFHRAWALSTILRDHRPAKIMWFSRANAPLDKLADYCQSQGARLVMEGRPVLQPLRQRIRQWALAAKTAAYDCRTQWHRQAQLQQRGEDPPATDRVVFSDYYANSAKVSLAVAQGLEDLRKLEVVFVAGREQVHNVFRTSGHPTYYLDEFSSPEGGAASGLAKEFRAAVSQLGDEYFETTDGTAPCRDYLLPLVRRTGSIAVRRAATLLPQVWGMLQALRPSAVVSTTFASAFGRAHALAANKQAIQSIYLQHGILGEGPFFSYLPFAQSLVWGTCNKRSLVECGVSEQAVRVVGAPNHDELAGWRAKNRGGARPSNGGARILFLASRAGGSVVSAAVFEKILLDVCRATAALDRAQLVVKLHPADHTGIAARLLADKQRVTLKQSENSLQLLTECDVAIVTSSTTGLEACALDRPLVVYVPDGICSLVNYERYGAAIHVSDGQRLEGCLRQALFDDSSRRALAAGRQKLVEDMLNGANGEARMAAAAAIYEIVKG